MLGALMMGLISTFLEATCNCQMSGFVLGALICTGTFFASHLQLSDQRIRAGRPHQHLSRKSPATVRRADSSWVPTSATFALVLTRVVLLETCIFLSQTFFMVLHLLILLLSEQGFCILLGLFLRA